MTLPSSLRIAAAQCAAVAGDIEANVTTHCRFLQLAADSRAHIVVFPELSLSGYELPSLHRCATSCDDPRLMRLRALVRASGVIAVVGGGLRAGPTHMSIGALAFFPDGSAITYRKQYLHPGEERFVVPGTCGSGTHRVGDHSFALAICADIAHPEHAKAASAGGASLYLAGVLITPGGYEEDAGKMRSYAARLGLVTLMANYGAPSGGFETAGRSAIWSAGGELLAQAPALGDHLVIGTESDGQWSAHVIAARSR